MRRVQKCRKCGHPQVTHHAPGEIMYCSDCNNPTVVGQDAEVFG